MLLEERSYALQQSIADHLLSGFPEATAVRLIGQTHAVPSQYDVQRGLELSDRRLYQEVPLGDFTREDERTPVPVAIPITSDSDSTEGSADAADANERSQP